MSTVLIKKQETTVLPRFYTLNKTTTSPSKETLFLGLELEFEFDPLITWRQKEYLLREITAPWWYAKYDSTVPDGLELVTHPATESWHLKNYNELAWRLDILKFMGCYVSHRCGIHVHMNKSAFTQNQFINFQKLIYEYPEFTLLLANRSKGNLKEWASIYDETLLDRKYKARTKKSPPDLKDRINRKWGSDYREDKFVAVNVLKKNTNEVRIFRSSLHTPNVFKCLEFCMAAYHYSGSCKIVTLEGFVKWCKSHDSQYPRLIGFLKKHKYM